MDFKPDFKNRIEQDAFIKHDLLKALNENSPVTIRKHPYKQNIQFEGEQPISWCSNAFQLPERPLFTLEPLFHAGSFYPQEAGSMLLDATLKQLPVPENPFILDLCAAPGGKSTLIASYLDNKGILVSNEVINQRARILKENITKWGYSNCIVTNNDPSDFERIPGFFDVVVVDAPCSGEGMFRKDHQAREEWSTENVALCAGRQKRILSDVWDTLKEGGFLIYSTCTFNADENESNVKWLEATFGCKEVQLTFPDSISKGRDGIGHYGFPGISDTEGFFIAVLQKFESAGKSKSKKNKGAELSRQKDLFDTSKFAKLDQTSIYNWRDQLLAVPDTYEYEFKVIQEHLHIVKWGTEIGSIAKKGIIPSHDLAMNFSMRKLDATIELDHQQALNYLHGDTFVLVGNQGFQLMTYQKEPLGWIKHLGNRFNNLYPKEWRIRMDVH